MNTLFCPSCGGENPLERSVCQKCKADLGVVKSILDTANLHYNRALTLAGEGRYPEAELEATAALELYNKNPRYHNLLGTIYARQGKFNRAQEAWETTLYLEEDTSSAYRSLQRVQRLHADGFQETPQKRSSSVFDVLLLLLLVLFGWLAHRHAVQELRNEDTIKDRVRQTQAMVSQEPVLRGPSASDNITAEMQEMRDEMRQFAATLSAQFKEQNDLLRDQLRQDRFLSNSLWPDDFPGLLQDATPQIRLEPDK